MIILLYHYTILNILYTYILKGNSLSVDVRLHIPSTKLQIPLDFFSKLWYTIKVDS